MVALECARGLGLVEDTGARSDELLVELPLVVAPVPALSIKCLQPLATHVDPFERAHRTHHLSPLAELIHGAERGLWHSREMQLVVRVVQGLEREGARHCIYGREGTYVGML